MRDGGSRPTAVDANPSDDHALGIVAQSETNEPFDQLRVFDARGLGRTGEILVRGDLRIGVGFEKISLLVVRDPEIQPRIAAETEQPIDVA